MVCTSSESTTCSFRKGTGGGISVGRRDMLLRVSPMGCIRGGSLGWWRGMVRCVSSCPFSTMRGIGRRRGLALHVDRNAGRSIPVPRIDYAVRFRSPSNRICRRIRGMVFICTFDPTESGDTAHDKVTSEMECARTEARVAGSRSISTGTNRSVQESSQCNSSGWIPPSIGFVARNNAIRRYASGPRISAH
jgi:hypothetical protein